MPLSEGDTVSDLMAMYCDGETAKKKSLSSRVGGSGCVLFFFGFIYGAISRNWMRRIEQSEVMDIDPCICGVARDGPYAVNRFIRTEESPIGFYSDVDGGIASEFDLLEQHTGMVNASIPKRSLYFIDSDMEIGYRWLAGYEYEPFPVDELIKELD